MIRKIERCYVELGRKVRTARLALGLSQDGLAFRIGLTRASVANIEGGNQRVLLHDLPTLAAALRIPVRRLLPASWVRA